MDSLPSSMLTNLQVGGAPGGGDDSRRGRGGGGGGRGGGKPGPGEGHYVERTDAGVRKTKRQVRTFGYRSLLGAD